MKSYTELMSIPSYEDRFLYLQEGIVHSVGDSTFGSLRYNNQYLYRSRNWKLIRSQIIVRDKAFDLAYWDDPLREIRVSSLIRVHHINPLTPEMFDEDNPLAYDPENLICTHFDTHQRLTYGGKPIPLTTFVERKPYDHCPWKKEVF